MKNLVVSALVSLLVAVGVSGASIPSPVSGGRANNAALTKLKDRVSTLEADLACFTGPIMTLSTLTTEQGTMYVQPADGSDPSNNVYVATVKGRCVA